MLLENRSRERLPDIAALLFRSVLGWTFAILLGVLGVFITRFIGFSNMVAAQITAGIFGLGGGLSHVALIRSAGADVSWRHGLLFPVIWALSCIGGVTPLFFVTGTALKMGMLTFYSFAAFGALGGVATALVMRPLFSDAYAREVIPCTLIWSFSLGFAAIASDALGEGLRIVLPGEIAWIISSGVLALIIGCGGGFSIVRFLRKKTHHKEDISIKSRTDPYLSKGGNAHYVLALILLCVPFYLNDLSNIYVRDWRMWVLIDYTSVKLFPFLVVLWLISTKRMQASEFGLTAQSPISFVTVFLIGTLVVTFIDQNGYLILNRFPGYPPLGAMPEIKSPLWDWIDLTFGLLMVGIFEEIVFRGYLYAFLARYTQSRLVIIAISSIAFSLIHWSGGLHMVMISSAAGVVFMLLYLRTFSLPAIMLAHFAVDFIDFADVIPKFIFRLF